MSGQSWNTATSKLKRAGHFSYSWTGPVLYRNDVKQVFSANLSGAYENQQYPRLRPQPSRDRNHLVEHPLPGAGSRHAAPDRDVPDHLLAHLSPLGWEHVNLTGDYIWAANAAAEDAGRLGPLRAAPAPFLKAA